MSTFRDVFPAALLEVLNKNSAVVAFFIRACLIYFFLNCERESTDSRQHFSSLLNVFASIEKVDLCHR